MRRLVTCLLLAQPVNASRIFDGSVIDTASGRVTATVKAGDGPWGVAVSP